MSEENGSLKAYIGAELIDGTGAVPLENAVVLVEGKYIQGVGSADDVQIPDDAQMINIHGKTVMPGLIDAHMHFLGMQSLNQVTAIIDQPHVRSMRSVMDAWRVLDAGFTTVRDAGGMIGIYLKHAVEEGSIIGPRILAAGKAITQTAGHGDFDFVPEEWNDRLMFGRRADGVTEVRKACREQLREGADFLKIMTTGGVMSEKDKPTSCQYSMDEIRAFVEEAKNAGVRTATHAQGTQGIKNAVLAGIDSVEHGIYLDDETIELMLERGTMLVPTLAIVDVIVTKGREVGVREASVLKAEQVQAVHIESFKKANQAGIICGLGTDYLSAPSSPHGENAVELDIYVNKIGLSAMETIVCATRNNARILGLEKELGTLEAGKQADLLVVDGDPLADITVLRDKARILTVLKAGQPVPRLCL
jgi:imidazolonepropionase-like amidohydrolase